MNSEDLRSYIIEKLEEGLNVDQVRIALVYLGRSEEEIDKIFNDEEIQSFILKNEELPPPPPPFFDDKDDGDDEVVLPKVKERQAFREGLGQGGGTLDVGTAPPFNEGGHEGVPDTVLDLDLYIHNSLRQGFSEETIRRVAIDAGWSGGEVDKIFHEAK